LSRSQRPLAFRGAAPRRLPGRPGLGLGSIQMANGGYRHGTAPDRAPSAN